MDRRIPFLLAEYDTSDSGWFKMKQFECWFSKTIIPCTRKSEAQKLALSDNLSPHFSEEVTGLSLSFECFPPNTTHFMQPLNVAVFGPLKKQWRAILNK